MDHRYYRTHGPLTDPGHHSPALDELPNDVGALAAVVRGLLIHGSWLHLYGLVPEDMPSGSRETLPVAQRLDAVLAGSTGPFSREWSPRQRAVATCRDNALMLCAFLRQKKISARVRCGFARYFNTDHHEDHWICEYWKVDEARWAVADAQLDAEHRAHLAIAFDTIDLPSDQFLSAGEAWRRVRAGLADATSFGHGAACGPWFLRVNLARDLLALGKREVSDWDGWRGSPVESRACDKAAASWCDQIADVTTEFELSLAELPGWCEQLRPFWTQAFGSSNPKTSAKSCKSLSTDLDLARDRP